LIKIEEGHKEVQTVLLPDRYKLEGLI